MKEIPISYSINCRLTYKVKSIMIKVSVIIPVYNGQKYIKECIESILHQNLLEIEIIIVDDGSTDGTGSILKEFEKIFNVVIICSRHLGLSVSRNLGFNIANGEYIFFVDADDRLHDSGSLKELYYTAKKRGVEIVSFDTVCFDINGKTRKQNYSNRFSQSKYFSGNSYFCEMMDNGFFCSTVWSYFIKKDILKKIRFIPYIYYEDTPFIYELLKKNVSIYYLKKIIYEHRIHSDSIMGSKLSYKKVKSNFIVLKQLVRISKREVNYTEQDLKCIRWNAQLLMKSLNKLKEIDNSYKVEQLLNRYTEFVCRCDLLNNIDNLLE